MRKEYNDRQNAPLVNPGFTQSEYEAQTLSKPKDAPRPHSKPSVFVPTIDGQAVN